jgi:hypothetical protein
MVTMTTRRATAGQVTTTNSVGGRRIPSVDRAALRAASTELRSVDFGMDRAWVALQRENEAEYDDGFSRVLGCCEAWVRHACSYRECMLEMHSDCILVQ